MTAKTKRGGGPAQVTAKGKAPTNPVLAAREVVNDSGCKKVDGVLLDLFTAGAIVQVADALSAENRERLEGVNIVQAANIVWKLVSK